MADLSAHAGNFVRVLSGWPRIAACGTCLSLVNLESMWPELSAEGASVYVRLNVSRAVRLDEHEDLVSSLKPDQIFPEPR